jgi:hypothetical protein
MTNLPVPILKKLKANLYLSELRNSSRRLHAKLLTWESRNGVSCLVGSANFTSAAFDARNVEACLLVAKAGDLVSRLFDSDLGKKGISFDDFDPGTEKEPEPADTDTTGLRLISAVLSQDGRLRVAYRHRLDPKPSALRVSIRTPGEKRPRASLTVPNRDSGTTTVGPLETALADAHGTILATLVADLEEGEKESPPVWIVQETHLTYEAGEGSSSTKSRVEETGEGLIKHLDDIAKREGLSEVIEYLRRTLIEFRGGGGGLYGQRRFRVRIHDPFHPDIRPDWLLNDKGNLPNLEEAVYDFVERHLRWRLHRHAKSGNINGIDNFLDILTALVRLLYVYFKREVVKSDRLTDYLRTFIELCTIGRDTLGEDSKESFDGYLSSAYASLGGAVKSLREVCGETNFVGHVIAVLLIAQKTRFERKPDLFSSIPHPTRPRYALTYYAGIIKRAIATCGLGDPKAPEVRKALESYQMFTDGELSLLLGELSMV